KYGSGNQPPSVNIASPADGAVFVAPATSITLSANASDSDGTVSKVDFFQSSTLLGTDSTSPYAFNWLNVPAGSYLITARATDNGGSTTTSAPISIIVDVPPVVNVTSITNGATFTAPAAIQLTAVATDADGTVAKVEFFNATNLLATDVSSPYANLLTNVAAGNYAITAQATDNNGVVSTSSVVNITVTAPVNQPPSVSLTSPLNASTYNAPAVISLSANASDSDGTVSKVDFYQGATLLATLTAAPYAFTWTGITAGSYSLTAKATDNSGAVATSSPISITVNPPSNQPPTVSLLSPGNGSLNNSPANLLLQASASDSDGTVTKVEFYNGVTLVATITTPPYSFTWTNVPVGNYLITAQATDNSGAVTISDAVTTTIAAASAKSKYVVSTTAGTLRNDFTGWVGESITVGSSPITVSDLGRYAAAGNSASHALKIVAASTGLDVPGTLVTVSLAGSTAGQYVYATLPTTVTLTANTAYHILSQEINGGDKFSYWNSLLTVNPVAICNGSVNSSSSTWLMRGPINTALGPVDFKYLVGNAVPQVAITVPTNTTSFITGTNILITALASDPNGTVSKVDFYANATLLGTSLNAPYSYNWINVPIGIYALYAIATDNAGATAISAAVNISITPVGGHVAGGSSAIAHRAYDAFVTTTTDSPVAITLNALSGSGDPLTYVVLTAPAGGILSGNAPNLLYTPNVGFSGGDSFTFLVNDETTASAPATVSLNVLPANHPPSVQSQSVATLEGQPLDIDLSATDLDGDLLAFNLVGLTGNGNLAGTPPNLVYTPRPNFTGVDSFFFSASDGQAESPLGIVSINVTPLNKIPVAQTLTLITGQSGALSLSLDGSDPEGLPLTFEVVSQPANGTLEGNAPYLIYTPLGGFIGTDSFEFKVNDGSLDSIPATVSIIVTEAP
ncbi:MAG: tandem-95 repeat protein, partial [Verrucomicrobia bacterium]|nr:tandem-95 repeat protein [Verrucomicrobiota bacterium]